VDQKIAQITGQYTRYPIHGNCPHSGFACLDCRRCSTSRHAPV
jgi:hypothetical protein